MDKLKKFLRRPLTKRSAVIVLVLASVGAGVIILRWGALPPELPLYYSLPWGEQQLASPYELLLLPIISLVFYFLNLLLAFLFAKENRLLYKILVFTAVFAYILLTYSLIRIVFRVT